MYIFLNKTQEIGQETEFTKKNPRLELFRQGFQYNDPITYNNLPHNIKNQIQFNVLNLN